MTQTRSCRSATPVLHAGGNPDDCHVAEFARPDRPIAEPIPNSRHEQRVSSGWLCQAARGTAGDGFQGNLHDNK